MTVAEVGLLRENREWLIGFGAVALILAAAWVTRSALAAHRRIATHLRNIHLQQETIVGMLIKAGFRPVRSQDWLEDGDGTRRLGDTALTRFDWRKPE